MEPWRICRSVVPDLHHFDKDQDPGPDMDLNQSEQSEHSDTFIQVIVNIQELYMFHSYNKLCEPAF
jgi:hypothetical protein